MDRGILCERRDSGNGFRDGDNAAAYQLVLLIDTLDASPPTLRAESEKDKFHLEKGVAWVL